MTLADGRRVARWNDPLTGKLQQQSLDALRLTTAEQRTEWAVQKARAIAETKSALAAGVATSGRAGISRTVADYLERFSNPATRANKRIVLDSFAEWCAAQGIRDVQDIKPVHLARWRERLFRPATSTLQTSTRNRWVIAVTVFVNWLRGQGLLPMVSSDAARQALRRERQPKEAIRFLRPSELVALFDACLRHDQEVPEPARVSPVVLLALLTGMRSTELRLLAWSEVDLAAGEIRLPATRTKSKAARTISLDICPKALELLSAMREKRQGERVFPHLSQGRIERAVRRIRALGAPAAFSMHAMRRTCGTLMTCAPSIFGAASVFLSARRLGHEVEVAERCYVGMVQVPPSAKTLEAAAGIEDAAVAIIERVRL